MLLVFLLTSSVAFIPRWEEQAAAAVSEIRVGVATNQPAVDFKIPRGNYQLVDKGTGKVVKGAAAGEAYRAQLALDKSGIQLFAYQKETSSWQLIGTFKGPLVLQEVTSGVSRGRETEMNLIEVEGKCLRGGMEIRFNAAGDALNCVNFLALEDYLCGVLPREVSDSWPLEALKAQAVAARTYALRNLGRHREEGFDLCDTSNCQVYGGYSAEAPNCTRAVRETRGQVLVDEKGELIAALYHSNSGGHTEDNAVVNGYDLPYLRGKPDPYSLGYGLSDWGLVTVFEGFDSRGREGLRNLLQKEFPSLGRIESLELVKYPSGRVQKVIITDERGYTIEKTGGQFGSLFNPGFRTVGKDEFMSRLFDVHTDATISILNGGGEELVKHGGVRRLSVITADDSISTLGAGLGSATVYQVLGAEGMTQLPVFPSRLEIEGHGWGHGVGMSQWGAYGMALQGFKYTEILAFYYPGTRLVTLSE